MAQFTVERNKRYQCQIQLSYLESFADNSAIVNRLIEAGFIDIDIDVEGIDIDVEGEAMIV